MQSFSEQCLDMARSMLGHNLDSINPDGSITPVEGEDPRVDESGHAALAIGEFYRATGETELEGHDLIDLAARLITAQAFREPPAENGLAYAALALLSFGPSKERNPVWERLVEPTRERLDKLLLARSDYQNHWQAFNIAKSVARYSMGLSKKDETGRLIDRFLERISERSSNGFIDDASEEDSGTGIFNIYGILSYVFIRQSLQLHANINLRERKLPSLRSYAEKYIRMLPDMTREDGLGWAYGDAIGAYGQMHCISLLLQSFRDGWIVEDQQVKYFDVLRRLFVFFFTTYLDQEHGYLVIRDSERNSIDRHTTRMANFDGARYLSQWSRLALSVTTPPPAKPAAPQRSGRFVFFDKSNRKEQGLYIYRHPESGLHVQLPLVGATDTNSDALAFPHCPGIFDWPVDKYLPIMLPELTIDGKQFIPSFYGKKCVTGLGPRNSLYWHYEQPDLITKDQEIIPGIGSCKVSWSFTGKKITSEFVFTVKNNIQLEKMRYAFVIGAPHSQYRAAGTLGLGPDGLGCEVLHDDFQASWQETEVVTDDPAYRSLYGKIHYIQHLRREHPLNMRVNQLYKLTVSFDPDIVREE
ncbi:MAG TPA: hypothetical protein VK041_04970 [Opitutales bacterium]|nr:hypothetical protein [Opitutales bacterium]